MASFKTDVYPDKIVKTLTFRGSDFVNTWVPDSTGSHTLEKPFEEQVMKQFPDMTDALIEDLGASDEDEVQEIMQYLTDCE